MSRITFWFGFALMLLGFASYVLTGYRAPTSLIPAAFGLILTLLGSLARTTDSRRRKIYMHAAVTVGLISAVVAIWTLFTGNPSIHPAAREEKATMAILSLIFVLLCVRSFVNARRSRA